MLLLLNDSVEVDIAKIQSVAGNGPPSTLAISRLTNNITSSNRALKSTFPEPYFLLYLQWVKTRVKSRLCTYLKCDFAASGRCFGIIFSSTHVPLFYSLVASKRAVVPHGGLDFPESIARSRTPWSVAW